MEKTSTRLEILFCLLNYEERNRTVTNIAKSLNLSKATVSRTIHYFGSEGIVEGVNLSLTFHGKILARRYHWQKEQLVSWLMQSGTMEEKIAYQEAINLIVAVSEDTLEILIHSVQLKGQNLQRPEDIEEDNTILELLEDGRYDITFTLYRHQMKEHSYISMANEGFYHPAHLIMKKGKGQILLKPKKIFKKLPGGIQLIGQVDGISYMESYEYKKASQVDGMWRIPIDSIRFHHSKKEQVLKGQIMLRVNCSAAKLYMPESIVMFSMMLAV